MRDEVEVPRDLFVYIKRIYLSRRRHMSLLKPSACAGLPSLSLLPFVLSRAFEVNQSQERGADLFFSAMKLIPPVVIAKSQSVSA
jgi:hypothetical protein